MKQPPPDIHEAGDEGTPPGVTHEPDEVNVHCDKKDKAMYVKYYLSAEERRNLIQDLGDAACMLFEYYLRMASIPNQVITDERAADYFGWHIRKVQRNRQALQKAGWYDNANYSIGRTRRGVSYYIGKEAVAKTRKGNTP